LGSGYIVLLSAVVFNQIFTSAKLVDKIWKKLTVNNCGKVD